MLETAQSASYQRLGKRMRTQASRRYKEWIPFPKNPNMPERGDGPRCKVLLDSDGPWTRVLIMSVNESVEGHVETEEYVCLMPRCYVIPLMMINKAIAFYESLRQPNGFAIDFPAKEKGLRLTWRNMREYTYLWRLRHAFLDAIYAANHEEVLDENWRWKKIHGYLYREYSKYGHTRSQRRLYRDDEKAEGRTPYTVPDVSEMNWKAVLGEDRKRKRWRSFLWRHVSQGYDSLGEEDVRLWLEWPKSKCFSVGDDLEYEDGRFWPGGNQGLESGRGKRKRGTYESASPGIDEGEEEGTLTDDSAQFGQNGASLGVLGASTSTAITSVQGQRQSSHIEQSDVEKIEIPKRAKRMNDAIPDEADIMEVDDDEYWVHD